MHMQNAVFKFILCKCVFPKNWTFTSIWLKSDLWFAPINSMPLHCQIFNSLRQIQCHQISNLSKQIKDLIFITLTCSWNITCLKSSREKENIYGSIRQILPAFWMLSLISVGCTEWWTILICTQLLYDTRN